MRPTVITADRKTPDRKAPADKQKVALNLELAEAREISEMIFEKLERKIRELQALEALADKKIETLARLLEHAVPARPSNDGPVNRQQEILALSQKGLAHQEIAELLDMPRGEVELVLALNQPQRNV